MQPSISNDAQTATVFEEKKKTIVLTVDRDLPGRANSFGEAMGRVRGPMYSKDEIEDLNQFPLPPERRSFSELGEKVFADVHRSPHWGDMSTLWARFCGRNLDRNYAVMGAGFVASVLDELVTLQPNLRLQVSIDNEPVEFMYEAGRTGEVFDHTGEDRNFWPRFTIYGQDAASRKLAESIARAVDPNPTFEYRAVALNP